MTESQPGSKFGQTMIYLAWILFLALLSYAFNQYLERQNNPNQQISTQWQNNQAEIRLKQNRSGHYLANGKINETTVTFLLDTGATLISIPQQLADKLQLK